MNNIADDLHRAYSDGYKQGQKDAQPENGKRTAETTQNVPNGDLISRKMAIDALGERPTVWSNDDEYSLGARNQYDTDKLAVETVQPAQTDLIIKIQNGIKVTDADDVYSCGMRNGMLWCLSLIDDKEPLYENCQSAQPERQRGAWIEYIPEHGKCPFCGNHVDLLGGKANNFCGECGADLRGEQE